MPAGAALGGDPSSYVEGPHHALLAAAILAGVGPLATAWLLIPRPEPAVEDVAPQFD